MSNIVIFRRPPTLVRLSRLRVRPKPGQVKALAAVFASRGWCLEDVEPGPVLIYAR